MSWKKRHRSFYYKYAEDPEDIILKSSETAHLIIDVQKTYLEPKENQKGSILVGSQGFVESIPVTLLTLMLRLVEVMNLSRLLCRPA